MAKQIINVGTSANDRQGDSLRTAFQKVNANFDELYISFRGWQIIRSNYTAQNGDRIIADTSDGLFTIALPSSPTEGFYIEIADGGDFSVNNLLLTSVEPVEGFEQDIIFDIKGLSLEFVYVGTAWQILTTLGVKGDKGDSADIGAFDFTGSVITTTDSTTVIIDQATNITSDLTVDGNVLPNVANGGDLGSAEKPWHSLYVSSNTIFIGSTALSIDENGNLLVGGSAIADVGTVDWNNITNIPSFSAVAISGSYTDLSNSPTIPVDINDLTDTGNLLFDGDYNSLSNQPNIPTAVGELTNDVGYITLADVTGEITVNPTGDLKGSVFADDSTLLVDGVSGTVPGTLTGSWNSPGNSFAIIGNGLNVSTENTALAISNNGLNFANSLNDENTSISIGSGNVSLSTTGGISVAAPGAITIASGPIAAAVNGATTISNADNVSWAVNGDFSVAANNININSGGIFANTFTGDVRGSVFADDSTLLVDGVNGTIVGPVETDSITASADTDLELLSTNDVNINTSVGDENHVFEFKDDGTFYMAKNSIDNLSYISTPRNDVNASLNLISALDVYIVTNDSTGSRETWTFGTDGSLILPTGATNNGRISNINGISLAVGTNFWKFDGDLTFPDDTVQTTAFTKILSTEDYIAGTQPLGIATGLIVTNNPQTNLIESSQNVNASGINFTLAIDGSGIATVTNIINGGTGQFVGKTFTVSGTAFFTNDDPPTFGTSPEDDITFEVTAIDLSSLAVLDLNKSVQKLTDGYYSLANGTEGQIMYFVPETGVTEGSSVNILIANVRQFSGGTATVQNNSWLPFFQNAVIDDGTAVAFNASTIAYAIFTDGAWNVFGGGMD